MSNRKPEKKVSDKPKSNGNKKEKSMSIEERLILDLEHLKKNPKEFD
jgi:hypothetical protein